MKRFLIGALLVLLGAALNGFMHGANGDRGSIVRPVIENGHTIIVALIGIALLFVFVIASRRFGVKTAVNFASVFLICLPAFAITALIMSSIFHPSIAAKLVAGAGTALVAWLGSRRVGFLKLAGYAFSMTMGVSGIILAVFILWEMFLSIR